MASLFRIVCAVGLLVMVAIASTPDSTRFWRAAFNFGHVPVFAAIALLVWHELRARRPTMPGGTRAAVTMAVAMVVGVGIEAVQAFDPHRSASIVDLLRDAAGTTATLLVLRAEALRRAQRSPAVGAIWAGVVLLVLVAVAEMLWAGAVRVAQQRALPTLAAFDGTWWESDVVHVQDAELTEARQGPARLTLRRAAPYPGIGLVEPASNWNDYEGLEIVVEAPPGRHLPLTIRVHDRWHTNDYSDRFNRTFDLSPGVHRLRIAIDDIRRAPRGRAMDMRAIRGLMLFVAHPEESISLGIGAITLVR